MTANVLSLVDRRVKIVLGAIVVALAALVLMQSLNRTPGEATKSTAEDEHGHEHAADTNSIELSAQALRNIDLQPLTIALGSFEKTISLPGMVVERPGKSQIRISAPLGGIVTRIYVIQGEAVAGDSPLFDVRLTHEELVSAQGEFLRLTGELDVVNHEIARLEAIGDGVIPGKRILDQKYERQNLEARWRAQQQALLLHGLSPQQIDEIVRTRQLLQSLTVRAPGHQTEPRCTVDHPFHVQTLEVQLGQQVDAGAALCTLADHCELYIEGTAFEDDAQKLREAAAAGTPISADLLVRDRREQALTGLKLFYLSDQVDRDSRAFHFYITLPNEIVLDRTEGLHRFMQWRFQPGQRVELQVPVERWDKRIVVPAEAVVSDGAEYYVYQQNGNRFQRVPVHVEFRNKQSAVIANDGALFPGDVIAGRGAFQIHLALKNKSGGPIDPHAGHSH